MGEGYEERAFIEMYDRYVEWYVLLPTAQWVRHGHPGLAALENPQFPAFAENQAKKREAGLEWLEKRLESHPWVAGERFSIADITAFCAIEFVRTPPTPRTDSVTSNPRADGGQTIPVG